MKKDCLKARVALMLFAMLLSSVASLAQSYSVIESSIHGTNGANKDGDEDCDKLFDDDTDTKWCVNEMEDPTYVEFETNEAITPQGYKLTTGGDTWKFSGRNPKDWVLRAKKNSTDEDWVTLDSVRNDTKMPTGN